MSKIIKVSNGDFIVDVNTGGKITLKADSVDIAGNFTLQGTSTSVNTVDLNIQDNLIQLNYGNTGTGISSALGYVSGIQIARGAYDDAQFVFDDTAAGSAGTFTLRTINDAGTATALADLSLNELKFASLSGPANGAISFNLNNVNTGLLSITNLAADTYSANVTSGTDNAIPNRKYVLSLGVNVGTTSILLSRASAEQSLTGITGFSSSNQTAAASTAISISSGTTTTSGTSGVITINSGNSAAASGNVTISTGTATAAASGILNLTTGTTTTSGATGAINLYSGTSAVGNTGDISIFSSSSTLAAGTAGNISITSGAAGSSISTGSTVTITAGLVSLATSTGGSTTIKGGTSSGATGTGGNVYIVGGSPTSVAAGARSGGNVYIDGGSPAAGGTPTLGTIFIGTQTTVGSYGTSVINIGNTSSSTTLYGTTLFVSPTTINLGTSTSAITTATIGGAFSGNILKLASTSGGTISLTTDVTTGTTNLFTTVTGSINIGDKTSSTSTLGFVDARLINSAMGQVLATKYGVQPFVSNIY